MDKKFPTHSTCMNWTRATSLLHRESKKQDTSLKSITSRNVQKIKILSLWDSAQNFIQDVAALPCDTIMFQISLKFKNTVGLLDFG